jgi:hypothetical protein
VQGRGGAGAVDVLIARARALATGSITDAFSYMMSDGRGGVDTATVTVQVTL